MKSKKLWAFLVTVVTLVLVYLVVGGSSGAGTSYRYVEVERGTVEQVVASTGSMQATETVEVGTQVSGLLSEIQVDFNDRVSAGQLMARIDPTILQQEVRSAEASLARSQAELSQAERDLARATRLYQEKAATETEYETAKYQHDVAAASFDQAQVALERARRNLEYTEIRAPIDGVVVERSVEVGQTVAASMAAPVLFILAGDLSEMEILASVDESDIGLIHQGEEVQFTVQAYPEEVFHGQVSQVRLQSTVVENVVTYSVVISVKNPDGRLLPGMTAMVEFVVERAENVFKVSNSALRFKPTEAMLAELEGNAPNGPPQGQGAPEPGNGEMMGPAGNPPTFIYYLDDRGKLSMTPVETGLTDGQNTVISGPGITEGMQIIAAVTTSTVEAASNPFQTNRGGPGGGGPPPPM